MEEERIREGLNRLSFQDLLNLLRDARLFRFGLILKEAEYREKTGKEIHDDKTRFTTGTKNYEDAVLDEIKSRIKEQWTDEIIADYLKEGEKLPSFITNAQLLKKDELLQLIGPGKIEGEPAPEFIPKIGYEEDGGIFFRHGEHKYIVREEG
jgi:hypothetical protein